MTRPTFWRRWLRPSQPTPPRAGDDSVAGPPSDIRAVLTGDAVVDASSLQILLESIAEVTSTMDLGAVLGNIVDKSLHITQAERAILLLGGDADSLQVSVARDREGQDLGADLVYSRSIVRRVMTEAAPMRTIVQSDREALELGQSVFDLKLRAVMCAPLVARDRRVGVIYVDSRAARREFSPRDLTLFGALSAQLAIAIVNAQLYADSIAKVRLEQEVELVRRIQQHLLAPVPPESARPGIELGLRSVACEHATGDSYDFVPLPDGRLAVVLGDATGHGIGPALLAHAVQAALRSYLELMDDAAAMVGRVNNRLVHGVESGNFLSLFVAIVDPPRRSLTYVNAGHLPPLLVRPDGSIETLERTGMVLGVVEDAPYTVQGPLPFEPGSLLLVRTDGVDEMRNAAREVFGEERLRRLLVDRRTEPVESILAAIDSALAAFRGDIASEDDVSMVLLRLRPMGEA